MPKQSEYTHNAPLRDEVDLISRGYRKPRKRKGVAKICMGQCVFGCRSIAGASYTCP